jgi:hypothetical protein
VNIEDDFGMIECQLARSCRSNQAFRSDARKRQSLPTWEP